MKIISIILTVSLLIPCASFAKSKDKDTGPKTVMNQRVKNLSGDDLALYNELTPKQQKALQEGKIETGYNAWMVKLALGEPYYRTEHHPIYKDYEEVWLYTRPAVQENVKEERIIDPTNNWPSIHRVKRVQKCNVDDFFLLFDRGVVDKVVKDTTGKVNGSCEITTQEEFIPIVDGKPKYK